MATLLSEIMEIFHLTSKKLRSIDIDLEVVVSLYKSLTLYVPSMRDVCNAHEINIKLK